MARAEVSAKSQLTITQELLASIPEGATSTREIFFEGATLSAEQVLGLWISSGGGDAAAALCSFVGIGMSDLPAAMTARTGDIGLNGTRFSSFFEGESTLGDTAVLLGRALAEPMIANALRHAVSPYVRVMGETPVVWFSVSGLRASAIERDGKVFFLILAGETLGGGLENTLFGAVLTGTEQPE